MIVGSGGFIATAGLGRPVASGGIGRFPLSIDSGGRFLKEANGTAFFINGDTAWCAIPQLSTAQMTTYLEDCATRGFNSVLVELMEKGTLDNGPNTYDGIAPFTTANDLSTPNNNFFVRADHFVSEAKRLNLAVLLCPFYVGYLLGSDGWWTSALPSTQAGRIAWGEYVGNRYAGYGNVVWVHGGDAIAPTMSSISDIVTGINNTASGQIHSYHAARTQSAFTAVDGETWFDPPYGLNNVYTNTEGVVARTATEYGRSPVRPVFMLESYYEGDGIATATTVRRDLWQTLCAGGTGHVYGNHDIWSFGGSGHAADYASHYADTGRNDMQHINALLASYAWDTLTPKTDTSLISSSLGSSPTQVAPALASDGSFAFIYVPTSQTVTLVKSALTPSTIRVRLYDPTDGSFSTHTASTSNTGTLSVATGGERVIVVDAA